MLRSCSRRQFLADEVKAHFHSAVVGWRHFGDEPKRVLLGVEHQVEQRDTLDGGQLERPFPQLRQGRPISLRAPAIPFRWTKRPHERDASALGSLVLDGRQRLLLTLAFPCFRREVGEDRPCARRPQAQNEQYY